MGRLTGVEFQNQSNQTFQEPIKYLYSYNKGGHVVDQQVQLYFSGYNNPSQNPSGLPLALDALYAWDNQGRMTSLAYPSIYSPSQGPTEAYSYDNAGRLSTIQETAWINNSWSASTVAAYGSLRDRLLAGPRGGDHCGYESWRALTASRDLTPDGCPQVQEAIKIGNNVVIRSLDRDCRRTVSLRGTTNPLSLSVAGSTFEVLEIGFSRPIGDQNIHRIAADFYIRAHAAVSKDIAEAILAQVRSVTRTPYLGVRLRSDTLFLTDCSFPAFYPFEDRPTIPNENEFYGMKYAACTVAGTWPIRCFEGVGRP